MSGKLRIEGGIVTQKTSDADADTEEIPTLGMKKVSVANPARKIETDFASSNSVKIKARGKKRTRQHTSLADLAAESLQTNDDEMEIEADHGSRNANNKALSANQMKHANEMKQRQENYAKALEKSELRTKKLKAEHFGEKVNNAVDFFDDDEEEKAFQLQRAKRLNHNVVENSMNLDGNEDAGEDERILAAIELAKKRKKEFEEKLKTEDRIMFSTALQFAGALDSGLVDESKSEPLLVKKEEDEETVSDAVNQSLPEPVTEFEEEKENKEDESGVADNALGFAEPIIDRGLGKVLELIRSRGLVHKPLKIGRQNDDRHKIEYGDDGGILIQHLDEEGHEMTEKQAFRYLSMKFHGQTAGISKKEKMKKVIDKQLKSRLSSTTLGSSSSKSSLAKLQKVGEKVGQAHVIFDPRALLEMSSKKFGD